MTKTYNNAPRQSREQLFTFYFHIRFGQTKFSDNNKMIHARRRKRTTKQWRDPGRREPSSPLVTKEIRAWGRTAGVGPRRIRDDRERVYRNAHVIRFRFSCTRAPVRRTTHDYGIPPQVCTIPLRYEVSKESKAFFFTYIYKKKNRIVTGASFIGT